MLACLIERDTLVRAGLAFEARDLGALPLELLRALLLRFLILLDAGENAAPLAVDLVEQTGEQQRELRVALVLGLRLPPST